MIRVLIADDHPIVREGLKQVIARASDMAVAVEATNGQEVLDHIDPDRIDVVVLDFSMPGKSGFDVLKDLRKTHPRLPILILSMHPESELAPRLLRAGASGYMTKESAPAELTGAIRKVHNGGTYVTPALAEKLAQDLAAGRHTLPHESLSDREFQVLCMLAAGKSAKEIAQEISLSVKTVRTYRDRIMEKMDVKNDVELTHYAIEHGLLSSRKPMDNGR